MARFTIQRKVFQHIVITICFTEDMYSLRASVQQLPITSTSCITISTLLDYFK